MAAPRPDPLRLALDHAIGLHRVGNGLEASVAEQLRAAFDAINGTIAGHYGALTRFDRVRLQQLYAEVRQLLGQAYRELDTATAQALGDLAKLESRYTEQVVRAAADPANTQISTSVRFTQPTAEQIRAIAAFPVQGTPMAEWWQKLADDTAFRLRSQIQLGLVNGESIPQIVARVGTIGRGGEASGALRLATAQATSLVRTSLTAVSAEAQIQSLTAAGPDVASEYQYVATLDNRTTPICRSLDGKVYRVADQKAPRPPQHWGCRSTIVPVVNWKALGITPPAETLTGSQRGALFSPDPYRDYASWLTDQPTSAQEALLGRAAATQFRTGRATLADLVRADGRQLTVAQLAARLGP